MSECFVFVYVKDNMIKTLGIEDARLSNSQLIASGWTLRATIDACVFIEHLHNQCDDVEKEIDDLSGRNKERASI